jgi:Alginate export
MKKLLLLAVLVLAFSATAYSQDVKLDFRASGFIDFRTEWYRWNWTTNLAGRGFIMQAVDADNKPGAASAFNKDSAYAESRMRLKFDAVMGKELSGTIFFEADSSYFGDYRGQTSLEGPMRNSFGWWGGDQAALEIKNIYFDVAVPYIPVPTTARFGLQPFGIRSNMFMYVDGAGVTVSSKIDPVQITAYWAKMVEGKQANGDDSDMYGLALNAKIDTFTIGGYGFYFDARTYPLNAGYTAPNVPPAYGSTANSVASKMLWLGVYADGRMGPVNLNFDLIYDNGSVKKKIEDVKIKYTGWASRLKVDYPWEAFNFGIVGAYGSGGDANKMSSTGLPGAVANPGAAPATSTKVGSYVVPIGSETGSFNEGEVLTASYINDGFTGINYSGSSYAMTRGSMGGIWLAKVYGAYKVTPDFKMTMNALYYGDTTKNGNTFGNAREEDGLTLKNSRNIGFEVDLINEWQIYKNLVFRFGGGVLWAGSALSMWNPATASNEKPNTPWIFVTRLTYSF